MIFVRKFALIYFSKTNFVDRIVQDLSSSDENNVSKAMQESDVLLKGISKTGVDRTVINKSSSQEQVSPSKRKRSITTKIYSFFSCDRCVYECIRKRCERTR
jgi:hypothetical protein